MILLFQKKFFILINFFILKPAATMCHDLLFLVFFYCYYHEYYIDYIIIYILNT